MTSITKIGGVMIVTQVIPQDQSSIQLQSAAAPTQAPPTAPEAPPTVTCAPPPSAQAPPVVHAPKMDDMTAAFLRGQPHGLGVVQIFIGVLTVLFSLTAIFSPILMLHAPLCLAVTFIISGSVLLSAAAKQTTAPVVLASLVWNMISAVVGLVGVAYVSWLLAGHSPSERLCETKTSSGSVLTDEEKMRCVIKLWMLNVSVYGPLGLLLVLLVLQVCVSVTVCVFSCKAVRRRAPIMVVADADSCLLCPAAPYDNDDDDLLDGGEEASPPNSP